MITSFYRIVHQNSANETTNGDGFFEKAPLKTSFWLARSHNQEAVAVIEPVVTLPALPVFAEQEFFLFGKGNTWHYKDGERIYSEYLRECSLSLGKTWFSRHLIF